MTYDSLLLNCGSGIISDSDKAPQHSGSAALCIGIGGTGIAALSDLKGKIHQHLQPDNPGELFPRYEAIQLLGIDSDEVDYTKYRGNCRLSYDEFVSIKKDNLTNFLSNPVAKRLIQKDPRLNWMEIDKITQPISPEGAGGIRQMGRYMLMEQADAVIDRIQEKAGRALTKRSSANLDVYIFAGMSGGTGSGCFLDVSYLIRQVAQNNGWSAKIAGYFFLPDVVTSKEQVSTNPVAVAYNNSNGYAALKELDYLMNLPRVNDWFEQNYGNGCHIRTQEPPVDMCHLVSAQQPDGRLVYNGFGFAINLASDNVLSYLADSDGVSMRDHLAHVAAGVMNLPNGHIANLSYHILGASNAQIPVSQINTYLAIGFFKKFRECAYRPRRAVTTDAVRRFMEDNHFTVADVYNDLTNGSEGLVLSDIDRRMLASEPCCGKRELPRAWAMDFNSWLSECRGVRARHADTLNRPLANFDYNNANDLSLIGRLFRKLCDMSIDPEYGPYYAAAMLDNGGYDLYAALTGEIMTAEGKAEDRCIHYDNLYQWKVECNQILIDKRGNRRSYANFKASVEDLGITINNAEECRDTADVLREFQSQVKALYEQYFRPLCSMLDNLAETFMVNDTYLRTPEARQANAYTWQIFTLDDVKPRLDKVVSALNGGEVVNHFMAYLLQNSENWLSGRHDQIARVIKQYLLRLFADQTNRSLEDYLYVLYNIPVGQFGDLSQEVYDRIMKKVDADAVPMFWSVPVYPINNTHRIFCSNLLSIPDTSVAVCYAANQLVGHNGIGYTVRKTGINDRIFALRTISGVPLCAYLGISVLKADYDRMSASRAGAGLHLYANTGRGTDGSGSKDWKNTLPTILPYPQAFEQE